MKLPRRRFWLPLVALGVALVGVRLGFHYHLIGLWRGDAYYRGMPTSYWRDAALHAISKEEPPAWHQELRRIMGWSAVQEKSLPLFKNDPAARGVLLQLALDPETDHHIRMRAFAHCAGPPLDDQDSAAVRDFFGDEDRAIRSAAAHLLARLNRSEEAVEILLGDITADLRDKSGFARQRAWTSLWTLLRECDWVAVATVEERFRPMLQDEDEKVRANVDYVFYFILSSVDAARKQSR